MISFTVLLRSRSDLGRSSPSGRILCARRSEESEESKQEHGMERENRLRQTKGNHTSFLGRTGVDGDMISPGLPAPAEGKSMPIFSFLVITMNEMKASKKSQEKKSQNCNKIKINKHNNISHRPEEVLRDGEVGSTLPSGLSETCTLERPWLGLWGGDVFPSSSEGKKANRQGFNSVHSSQQTNQHRTFFRGCWTLQSAALECGKDFRLSLCSCFTFFTFLAFFLLLYAQKQRCGKVHVRVFVCECGWIRVCLYLFFSFLLFLFLLLLSFFLLPLLLYDCENGTTKKKRNETKRKRRSQHVYLFFSFLPLLLLLLLFILSLLLFLLLFLFFFYSFFFLGLYSQVPQNNEKRERERYITED